MRTRVAGRQAQVTIDLRSLPAGVYLVKLLSGDVTTTRKLVVQR